MCSAQQLQQQHQPCDFPPSFVKQQQPHHHRPMCNLQQQQPVQVQIEPRPTPTNNQQPAAKTNTEE